eukprot:6176109-Pleurochrysis_carterae.AAC.3
MHGRGHVRACKNQCELRTARGRASGGAEVLPLCVRAGSRGGPALQPQEEDSQAGVSAVRGAAPQQGRDPAHPQRDARRRARKWRSPPARRAGGPVQPANRLPQPVPERELAQGHLRRHDQDGQALQMEEANTSAHVEAVGSAA